MNDINSTDENKVPEENSNSEKPKKKKHRVLLILLIGLGIFLIFEIYKLFSGIKDEQESRLKKENLRYSSEKWLQGYNLDTNITEVDFAAESGVEGLTNEEAWNMGLSYNWDYEKECYVVGIADTDMDGISDNDEINLYKSDPLKMSTAGDLYADGEKVKLGLDLSKKADREVSELPSRDSLSREYVTCTYEDYDDYFRTYIGDIQPGGNFNCLEFKYEDNGISGSLGYFDCSYRKGNRLSVDLTPFLTYAKELGLDVDKNDVAIVVKNGETLEYTVPKLRHEENAVSFDYPSDYHRKYMNVDNAMYHLCSTRDTVYVCAKGDTGVFDSINSAFKFGKTSNVKKFKELVGWEKTIEKFSNNPILEYDGDFIAISSLIWETMKQKPKAYMIPSGNEEIDLAVKKEICRAYNEGQLAIPDGEKPSAHRERNYLYPDNVEEVTEERFKTIKSFCKNILPPSTYCTPYTVEKKDEEGHIKYSRIFAFWYDMESYLSDRKDMLDNAELNKEILVDYINNSCKVTYDDFFPFENDNHCLGYAWIVANVYNNGSIQPINDYIASRPDLAEKTMRQVGHYYNETSAFQTLYDKGLRDIEVTPELQDYFDFVWAFANLKNNETFDYCHLSHSHHDFATGKTIANTGSVLSRDGYFEVSTESGCYFSKGTTGEGDKLYSWNTIQNVKNYIDQDKIAILDIDLNYNTQDIKEALKINADGDLRSKVYGSARHSVNVYGYKDIEFNGKDYVLFSVYDSNYVEGADQEYLVVTEDSGTFVWAYIPSCGYDSYYFESTPFNYVEQDAVDPNTGDTVRFTWGFDDDTFAFMSGECLFFTDELVPLNEYITIPNNTVFVDDSDSNNPKYCTVENPADWDMYIKYGEELGFKYDPIYSIKSYLNTEGSILDNSYECYIPLAVNEPYHRTLDITDKMPSVVHDTVRKYRNMAGTHGDAALYRSGIVSTLSGLSHSKCNYRYDKSIKAGFANEAIFEGCDVSFQAWRDDEMRRNAILYVEGREDEITDWSFMDLIKYYYSIVGMEQNN
ncbi:hypothetical protein SAMN02910368_02230 [Lachnospiraceae bacterium G11]|nr:hypothetical protein SAMN02910368_02230 [Lachnospiraceae bacterium G11]